jgi:hypothetical protein
MIACYRLAKNGLGKAELVETAILHLVFYYYIAVLRQQIQLYLSSTIRN